VEEEFFLFDPLDRSLANGGLPNLGAIQHERSGIPAFDHEFQASIVESRTGICPDLQQVRRELETLRRALVRAATESDLSVLSAGTMPLASWRTARVTQKARYRQIAQHYREVVHRRATCGCHVHVGIADRDLAVQVINRVRPWLPVLLALSTSSPFYESADTGYQSSRNLLWGAFPVAGGPGLHNSYKDYDDKVALLIATGAILDVGHVYWDARVGTKYETVEFRIADACTTVDETVLQAGLCRALALTSLREIACDRPIPAVEPELIRAASWRAARSGLDDCLIDVIATEQVPAAELLDRLLHYLRDALEELGDWEEIVDLVQQTRNRGTSARRQHQVLARSGRLEDVVDELAAETADRSTFRA